MRISPLTLAPLFLGVAALVSSAEVSVDKLASRAETVLAEALEHEKLFVKVHAAEALIALGERDLPRRVFSAELPAADEQRPYRIGVWRVLASSSSTPEERAAWTQRVESVVLDPAAPDRVHAIETLGKLGHVASGPVRAAAESMTKGTEADAVFAHWVLHLAGDRSALSAIVRALGSVDPAARLRAAYVLGWLKIEDVSARAAVARAALREPADAIGYPIVLGAAVTLRADPAHVPKWAATLENIVATGKAGARYHACQVLMNRYSPADLSRLVPLLDHPEGDARIGAAWAILHVARRGKANAVRTGR